MFLIAGKGDKLETVGQGEFFCPNCGDMRSYSHNRILTSVSLFFIPVWRSPKGPDFVECKTCGSQYTTDIFKAHIEIKEELERLLGIARECGSTSVECKDPEKARENYDRAVQAFKQALSLPMPPDIKDKTHVALATLMERFPSQSCMFHALGVCDQAETAGHVDKQLPLLRDAKDILEDGLKRRDVGYDAIMSIYVQVVDRIEKGEALSRKLAEKRVSRDI